MSEKIKRVFTIVEEHNYNKQYHKYDTVYNTIDGITNTYLAIQDVPQFISILNDKFWKIISSDCMEFSEESYIRYDQQQTLTNVQKRQVKLNIGADEVDNLESFNQDKPLSANQGKILNERVNNLEGIGRFLSLWNCETGLAESTPPQLPYIYDNGCYFRIASIPEFDDILIPNGTQYTGEPSMTIYTGNLALEVGDLFVYDEGSNVWLVQKNQIGGKVQDVKVNNTSILVNREAKFTGETWTATLTNGTTVTKKVVLYD